MSGSPSKPQELSEDDAIKLGREIRDYLIKGADIIASFNPLETVAEYEKIR